MFSTLDRQLAAGVEMDDLRHAVKGAAVLAQNVLILLRPRQLHVHEALAALKGEGVVILAGLAVSHKVAGFLAQPEQRLCVCSADGSVVPKLAFQRHRGVNTFPKRGAAVVQ